MGAFCNVLAVLSNCPQLHNPCDGYKPSPIKVTIAWNGRYFFV